MSDNKVFIWAVVRAKQAGNANSASLQFNNAFIKTKVSKCLKKMENIYKCKKHHLSNGLFFIQFVCTLRRSYKTKSFEKEQSIAYIYISKSISKRLLI